VRFELLGVSVALTWFLLVSTAVSMVAGSVAWLATRRWSGRNGTRPAGWLALRLLPSVAAGVFLLIAFGPAYLRFEPRNGAEAMQGPLLLSAAAGAVLVGAAGLRMLVAARRLSTLERGWLARAMPLPAPEPGLPAFVVEGPGPVATLVGVTRPRLYLSKPLLDALTSDERAAVLAHESAHRRRRDNLARWVMLATPDLFAMTAFGRQTAERWAAAAERLADEEAVGHDARAKVALASALIKVARLMPASPRDPLPTSGLDDGGILAERVKRLLGGPVHAHPHMQAWLSAVTIAVVVVGVTFASGELALHRSLHEVTEWLVRLSF
jgi:hypothetical protein